jgi:hypothetical protein
MILSHQTVSIVVMIISGLFIAATIDAFRFFWLNRKTTRLYKYHRFFELFLWIGFGIATFYLLFIIKGGVWRFVDPIAQFFGIFLYEKVMKRPFRIVGRILDFIIIRPIKWLGLLIIGIIRFILKIIVNFMKFLLKPFIKPILKLFQKIIKK